MDKLHHAPLLSSAYAVIAVALMTACCPPDTTPPLEEPLEGDEVSSGCDGQFLNFKGCGSTEDADAYYTQIDAEPTLEDWRANRCFDTGSPTNLFYLNDYDLGFGRDMRCTECGLTIACYVDNYGAPGSTLEEATAAFTSGELAATVAMDYDPSRITDRVRFYVYDADGQRATSLSLDTEGPKNVPHVCLACHGGAFDPETASVGGAAFLEFVPELLLFPNGLDLDETIALEALREFVLRTDPPAPIAKSVRGDLVEGASNVPSGWEGREALFSVVQRYCLGCHNAQTVHQFDTYAKFDAQRALIAGAVLDGAYMPHAERTYTLLQADAAALEVLERELRPGDEPCAGDACDPDTLEPDTPSGACLDVPTLDLFEQVRAPATPTLNQGTCSPSSMGASMVFALETRTDVPVCLSAAASTVETTLHVRTACDDPDTELACAPGGAGAGALEFDAASATPYFVIIETPSPGAGDFTLDAYPGPCCQTPPRLINGVGAQRATIDGAAPGAAVASCAPTDGPEVAFLFSVTADTDVCLSTRSETLDTVLHVRTACDDPDTEIACDDDTGGKGSQVAINARSGGFYYVFVEGYRGSVGPFELVVQQGACR